MHDGPADQGCFGVAEGAGGAAGTGGTTGTVAPFPPCSAACAAAAAAFSLIGFFGVSMRQVAAKAGVPPGAVISLFGGKHNLLKAAEARRLALLDQQGPSRFASIAGLRED